MHLTAADIAQRARGEVVAGAGDARVTSWSFDSRGVAPGACFVALAGHRDGHDFVGDALASGASVALVGRRPEGVACGPGQALVRVDDPLRGLQDVARSVRAERTALQVVGVTGSTGKTSTKDLLAAVLEELGCHANPESYNNEFGLPITLLNAPAGVPVVVTEMGERFPGDVALLCDIARPRFGVVTNVGLAHAEHLGGPEGVAAVLAELVEALPADGLAVCNADDPWTPQIATRSNAPVLTVGQDERADVRVTDVRLDDRLRPSFRIDGETYEVALRGVHQVANAAMAAVVGRQAFGLDAATIRRGLANARAARWRMELAETPAGVTVLNDAYNANPSSVEAALRALANLQVAGRRIAVLGDMRELGEHAVEQHERMGRLAAELGIDRVVAVGEQAAHLGAAAAAAGVAVRHALDARAALQALGDLDAGDAVLVKASRALGLHDVAEALLRVPSGVRVGDSPGGGFAL